MSDELNRKEKWPTGWMAHSGSVARAHNLLRIQELVIVVIMVKGSNCYGTIVTAIWNLNLTKMHTFLNRTAGAGTVGVGP